jgi:hypothetical protein
MFKPNLLLVVAAVALVWLANRWWRKVLTALPGLVLGVAAAMAISAARFGSLRCWNEWFAILPEVLGSDRPVEQGNFALSRLLLDRTGHDYSAVLLVLAFAAVAVAVAVRVARAWRVAGSRHGQGVSVASRADLTEQTFLAVGIGAAVMLVSARLAWMHYFVLVLPLAVYLLRPAALTDARSRWAARIGAVVLAGAALLSLSTVMLVIATQPWARAVWCNAAVVVMLLLALRELGRSGRPTPAAASHG